MKNLLLLLLVLTTSPVMAQDYTPVPPTEKTAKPNTPVVPWSRFCKSLVNHQPANDVAYEPGVDVHGRDVAPADVALDDGFQMPSAYRMFITSNQADKLGLDIPGSPLSGDMLIGEIDVEPSGRVTFNGQPVENERVYAVCSTIRN